MFKPFFSTCVTCGKENTLIKAKNGLCGYCKVIAKRKPTDTPPVKKSAPKRTVKPKNSDTDAKFFREVWAERMTDKGYNVCSECNRPLLSFSATYIPTSGITLKIYNTKNNQTICQN